jgi:hypothetical protein
MVGSGEEGDVVMTVGASMVVMVGGTFDVERRFLGETLRCPLAVARDLGRNFRTASALRPGHVVKKFFSMLAWTHVEIGGLKQAGWRKSMSPTLVFCS